MAVVDVKTGKIVGAKKGTLTYYHEEGHIAFDKTPKGFNYGYLWIFSIFCAVVFGAIYDFYPHWFTRGMYWAFVLLAVYYYAYEELWCWWYAYKKQVREQGKEAKK